MLKRCRRVGRWIAERLKDLFYGPGNKSLDHGRVMVFVSVATVVAGVGHNVRLGQPIDLGPMGLPGGLGAILTAAVIYIVKDRQRNGDGQ
jgi:hypothetical protein